MEVLAAALLLWPVLAFSQVGTGSVTAAVTTTTTLPPGCLDDEDCDDRDECTDDTCDDNGDCQYAPVSIDEQASCIIDNLHDIVGGPPALACAGACRCASLSPLLDRTDGLINASLDATTPAACRRRLHAARRTARRLRRRVERLAGLGCLAPFDRITRIDDQLTHLIERVPTLVAEGYCLP